MDFVCCSVQLLCYLDLNSATVLLERLLLAEGLRCFEVTGLMDWTIMVMMMMMKKRE